MTTLPVAFSRRAIGAFAALGLASIALSGIAAPRVAAAMVEESRIPGVALSGYDPVAYFTGGAPKPGSKAITLMHQGVEWRFASEANRERFRAEPARYAPQFGGFCAWAVSQGYTAPADPEAWAIEGGKLYLNYSLAIRERWQTDIPGHIAKGEANWPKLTKAP